MVCMESHTQIVNAIGVDAIADRTGVKPIGVKRWAQRDRIPPEHWVAVVDIARQNRVRGVTYEQLAILVAK